MTPNLCNYNSGACVVFELHPLTLANTPPHRVDRILKFMEEKTLSGDFVNVIAGVSEQHVTHTPLTHLTHTNTCMHS